MKCTNIAQRNENKRYSVKGSRTEQCSAATHYNEQFIHVTSLNPYNDPDEDSKIISTLQMRKLEQKTNLPKAAEYVKE